MFICVGDRNIYFLRLFLNQISEMDEKYEVLLTGDSSGQVLKNTCKFRYVTGKANRPVGNLSHLRNKS